MYDIWLLLKTLLDWILRLDDPSLGSTPQVPRSTLVLNPMSPAPPRFYSPCPPFTLVLLPMSPVYLGSTFHVPRSALVLFPTSPAPSWFYSPYPTLHLGSTGTTPVTHSPWLLSPCPLVLLPLSPTLLGSTPPFPVPLILLPWFYSHSPPLTLVLLPLPPPFYCPCLPLPFVLLPLSPCTLGSTPPGSTPAVPHSPLVLPQVLHSPCYYWKSSLNVISNCACLWFILQLLNS